MTTPSVGLLPSVYLTDPETVSITIHAPAVINNNNPPGNPANGINVGAIPNQFPAPIWHTPYLVHFVSTMDRRTKKFENISVKDAAEAVSFAMAYSAMGLDTYFACAEFASPDNRTSQNAVGACALWADIDVGVDKAATGNGYATVEEALAAVKEFCIKTDLPEPTHIINSGNGLHGYWAFDAFLERDQWIEYAVKFKALMKAAGLRADPSRTADLASVLRVPGTLNYKDSPPRPVTVLTATDEFIEMTVFLDGIDAAIVIAGAAVETIADVPKSASQISAPLQDDPDREPPNMVALESALKSLTPDCDGKTWSMYRIAAMATEARYFPSLHDKLYNLAKAWSSGELGGVPSVKWNTSSGNRPSGKQCINRVWKRFLTDTTYTGPRASLGTIYHHAKEVGWDYGTACGQADFDGGDTQ